eukprot:RCo051110
MRPSAWSHWIHRLRVEENALVIVGHLENNKIITAGVDNVEQAAVTRMVAVLYVANRVAVLGSDSVPITKSTINGNVRRTAGHRRRADAFKAPGPASQLIVVVVSMSTAHWFDISTVFLCVFVDKKTSSVIAVVTAVAVPLWKTGRNPFVPARYENKLGIDVQHSTLPLLFKVQATVHRIWRKVPTARMPASAHCPGFVAEGSRPHDAWQGVLSNTDTYLLGLTLTVIEHVLRIDLEPAPLVLLAWSRPVIGNGLTEGKKPENLRFVNELLVGEKKRLSVPQEPQLLPSTRLVQVNPKLVHNFPR